RDPLAFYLQLQECLTEMGHREATSQSLRAPADSPTRALEMPEKRRIPIKVIALAALFLTVSVVAAVFLAGYLRHRRIVQTTQPIGVPIGVSNAVASATPARAAGPVVILAPPKTGPQQQTPATAVNVTLISFTPMVGTP